MRIVSHKLPLKTIENCRDLGGIVNMHGQTVRSHLLIRSANLHHASQEDLNTLNNMGITHIIDLRTRPERELKPDHLLAQWSAYEFPTFIESQELRAQMRDIITRPGTFIEDLYPHLILDDAAVECWKQTFRLLINHPGGYLFHCTQGKDRTGIAAALILAALDVDEQIIRDDYLQTNLYMSQETPKIVETVEHLLGPKAYADIEEFLVATPLYFQTYLDTTQSFGGPKGYLQERIGLTDHDFEILREHYLQDSTAITTDSHQ